MSGWTELSNALSFGGSTARPQKRKVVKVTKEERDSMTRQMRRREIEELLRYHSDEDKERFNAIKKSLWLGAKLRGHALFQEALILFGDERRVIE